MAGENKSPPVYVTVSALDAGHLTLPENLFVTEADCNKRATVPSLAFFVKHPAHEGGRDVNLVFDLGLKRNLTGYPSKQQEHIANRHPIISRPDCVDSLQYGADWEPGSNGETLLDPATDVDMVILSHVHWDHVGTPSDFTNACFVVGSGTLDLLKHGAGPLYPTEIFNDDELPASRTVELPAVPYATKEEGYDAAPHAPKHTYSPSEAVATLPSCVHVDSWSWEPLANLPHVLDLFGDGSVFVIDSPGHLYGHVNLLLRVAERRFIYLGGDCCHDPRILSGEKGIALYDDGKGGIRSVHTHTGVAQKTLGQIDKFAKEMSVNEGIEVEVIVAHDKTWREKNRHRFWPGKL
ncbi:uncharacterized protein FPRO_05493 [Fusarium proliferatum ET1]|uniref:Metallo-beta-lactamase domain-containing protein n=1 Tax=Fusarium proliferatum (strain ET1) TaxID=1227346 RepID=A0A1L7VJ39_FUSPR|nr:uncharacterized protein FPRO_05493 [Fusarium proliferatum ET1]CZR40593.1 uncharacterized protein FPRO_05493 [Fusarium proliferatum ET1]